MCFAYICPLVKTHTPRPARKSSKAAQHASLGERNSDVVTVEGGFGLFKDVGLFSRPPSQTLSGIVYSSRLAVRIFKNKQVEVRIPSESNMQGLKS